MRKVAVLLLVALTLVSTLTIASELTGAVPVPTGDKVMWLDHFALLAGGPELTVGSSLTTHMVQVSTTVAPGQFGFLDAHCPAGDYSTGGGAATPRGSTPTTLLELLWQRPLGTTPDFTGHTPTGWSAAAFNPKGETLTLIVYAVCQTPPITAFSTSSGVGGGLTALVISSSTTGDTFSTGGNKVVQMAVGATPNEAGTTALKVVGVRVCYELTNARSFIDQIRLAQVQDPPSTALVLLDDGTHQTNVGPVCVNSTPTSINPGTGALLLSLRLNFGSTSDKIAIRALGLLMK